MDTNIKPEGDVNNSINIAPTNSNTNNNSNDCKDITHIPPPPNNNVNDRAKSNDDIFNPLTIEECDAYFKDHYENNIEQLIDTKDKLSLLRSCIELLNRLEGTQHDEFAGRVLLFLAKVIPFYDQSGFNLRSEFSQRELPPNVIATLKKINDKRLEKDKLTVSDVMEIDMEEGETLSDGSNEPEKQEDSERLYEKFWKVQQLLSQPNLLYDKTVWPIFRANIDTLLHKFRNEPASLNIWNLKHNYITDVRSLPLQMNDVYMRRCFLVQILVILQYLELPVEVRPENFVLDKAQITWSNTTKDRIYSLLDVLPDKEEGSKFLNFIRRVLRNEEMWNQWKNEKCKEPKKPEESDEILNMRGTYYKKRKISDELSSAKPYNLHVIGSQDMSRLWNMKPVQKYKTPELGKYLNIPLEKQNDSFKDPNYSFMVLRLLRKSSHFFAKTTDVIQSLDEYLKGAVVRYQS